RIYKTRTLAAQMVSRGKVRVNAGLTKKPAVCIGAGDVLTLVQGRAVRVLRVTGLPARRGPAQEASAHYDDVTAQ
ncbi:MAG: RNA-binding S4 domain-containing protein, partial [Pseudomonadota bacterium]